MKIKGKVIPLKDKVLACDMEFGMEKTKTGIILHSDNGKNTGIHPRWCKVWAVGPDQTDVEVGQWICVEHGRWTRTWEIEDEDGKVFELRGIDTKAIMIISDDKPEDVMRAA
jgi:co-chaperonin GroES (HSP10)